MNGASIKTLSMGGRGTGGAAVHVERAMRPSGARNSRLPDFPTPGTAMRQRPAASVVARARAGCVPAGSKRCRIDTALHLWPP